MSCAPRNLCHELRTVLERNRERLALDLLEPLADAACRGDALEHDRIRHEVQDLLEHIVDRPVRRKVMEALHMQRKACTRAIQSGVHPRPLGVE